MRALVTSRAGCFLVMVSFQNRFNRFSHGCLAIVNEYIVLIILVRNIMYMYKIS